MIWAQGRGGSGGAHGRSWFERQALASRGPWRGCGRSGRGAEMGQFAWVLDARAAWPQPFTIDGSGGLDLVEFEPGHFLRVDPARAADISAAAL